MANFNNIFSLRKVFLTNSDYRNKRNVNNNNNNNNYYYYYYYYYYYLKLYYYIKLLKNFII